MSYLSQPTSTNNYGVVTVGSNIQVQDGVISLLQDLSPNASVSFGNVVVTENLTLAGASVITSVTPTAGTGTALSGVVTNGPASAFTITNTGVLSLSSNVGIAVSGSTGNVVVTNTGVTRITAGVGIAVSANTGNITISGTGTSVINVIGVNSSYTATPTDQYIGVNSVAAVTITLPTGIEGRTYTIKDEHGQGSGKINITPQISELIDGAATYVISVPYQSVSVVYRAGSWHII